MYKEQKTVIKELRELFEIDNKNNNSREFEGKFFIDKRHFERFEVISKLQNYFNGVGVKDGYVKVSPMTMVFTTFEVCDGKPN